MSNAKPEKRKMIQTALTKKAAMGTPYVHCTIEGVIAGYSQDVVVLTDLAGSFSYSTFVLEPPGTRDMLATILAAISTGSTIAAAVDTSTSSCWAVWMYPATY